jgi:hypothetical protein
MYLKYHLSTLSLMSHLTNKLNTAQHNSNAINIYCIYFNIFFFDEFVFEQNTRKINAGSVLHAVCNALSRSRPVSKRKECHAKQPELNTCRM